MKTNIKAIQTGTFTEIYLFKTAIEYGSKIAVPKTIQEKKYNPQTSKETAERSTRRSIQQVRRLVVGNMHNTPRF